MKKASTEWGPFFIFGALNHIWSSDIIELVRQGPEVRRTSARVILPGAPYWSKAYHFWWAFSHFWRREIVGWILWHGINVCCVQQWSPMCCIDQLNRQTKADILTLGINGRNRHKADPQEFSSNFRSVLKAAIYPSQKTTQLQWTWLVRFIANH